MKNPIIYILGVVVVAIAAFFLFSSNFQQNDAPTIVESSESGETVDQIELEKIQANNQQHKTLKAMNYLGM